MILAQHGTAVEEAVLEENAAKEPGGVSIEELARLAGHHGLRAQIEALHLPDIAALVSKGVIPIVYLNRVHIDQELRRRGGWHCAARSCTRLFLCESVSGLLLSLIHALASRGGFLGRNSTLPNGILPTGVSCASPADGRSGKFSKKSFARTSREPVQYLRKIGRADLLIAASALAPEATQVTRNLRHFRQVPGLQAENWID